MSVKVFKFHQLTFLFFAVTCLFTALPAGKLLGQDELTVALPQITRIEQSDANITIDGFIDEDVWKNLPVIDGMKVIDPDTLADTPYETHVRFFYTERGIYLSAMNFQPQETLMARMTSRDVRLERDGFVVAIDASGEGLYGFYLRINLGNSLTDATILPERTFNFRWEHVAQITALAEEGAYDGVVFHRVIDGFMAQTGDVEFGKLDGGDMAMAGRGGSDRSDLPAEFSDLPFDRGVVGMARSQNPNSANSQFFIMFDAGYFLNGEYTVVGTVTDGMDVVDAIKRGDGRNGAVVGQPDVMSDVTVIE